MDTIEWLTGALVGITAYYAWRTQQMVSEMKRARELSVRPILALELKFAGPNFAELRIVNVGPGTAFDVDLSLRMEPAPGSERERDVRHWTAGVMVPGSSNDFRPPGDLYMDQMARDYRSVTIKGTMRDALGAQQDVHAQIADLADTWERLGRSGQLYRADPTEKATSALVKPLTELRGEVREIRRVATGEYRRTSLKMRRRRRRRQLSARLDEFKRRLRLPHA